MDLKPRKTVMGAYTAINCQELFVVQHFNLFDGKSVSAPIVPSAVSQVPSASPLSTAYFTGQCSSESPPGPPCPTCRTDPPSRRPQSFATRGSTSSRWGPTVHLCLGLCVKDRWSPLSPRMHDSELPSSPCPASRAQSIRRSGQGRVASVLVAYERYASGAHDRADSGPQLVHLVAFPRRLMCYFGSFSHLFFQLAVINLIGYLLLRRMY